MPELNELKDLIEKFDRNREAYLSGEYKETPVRVEFIDPFFKLLGWDVHNKSGNAEAYKDVYHEDALKIGGATKAPDYSFRIGGTRKFFLEAKKPSVNIKEDVSPAYQLRRYAWSAKLPLSVLTDFEEFAVYDCRIKPSKGDKASTARVRYLKYTEYAEKWDEIHSVFSRDAILKGSFDKYAESNKAKRGTAEVDSAFLKEIETWRENLARNLALRNSGLKQRELNFAVQRILDRIIFLRMCEDRGIEFYGQLQGLQNGSGIYPRLCRLFRKADDRYNSGLFHFKEEKGRSTPPDHLTLDLTVDDKILKDILKSLYYPESPYEFSVLPTEILGQVYEQFLGKVIRLTPGHRAVVEEKPEVKKAGGVYYTPSYIVEYIVKQTVGKLLEGKKPGAKNVVNKIKILDPACGSGSFLIGAYQFLLDWHRERYVMAPKKNKKALYQGPKDEWRLTTAERKRILLTHIYGVDVDPQAVETTKLSLLLKVLEGESEETLKRQLQIFQERALPDLGDNIKCGNSLIGPDFYDHQQTYMFNYEERYRINVFDWHTEFPEIMKSGGFNAVIGNPPYVRIQILKKSASSYEVEFYKKNYESSIGNYDIYLIFVEKGLELLKIAGQLGYILPNKFLVTDYGSGLRKIISEKKALNLLVDFGHSQVFNGATTYTCLLFLTGSKEKTFKHVQIESPKQILKNNLNFTTHSNKTISKSPWGITSTLKSRLLQKLTINTMPLLAIPTAISRGSSSGDDKVFILGKSSSDKYYTTSIGENVEIEKEILRIPLFATDFSRYKFNPKSHKVIIFPYKDSAGKYKLFSENEIEGEFPKAFRYLQLQKDKLKKRKQFKSWLGFSAPRNLSIHDHADVVVPLLADVGSSAKLPINRKDYCLMASGGFSISIKNDFISPSYILGLLNSCLLFWNLKFISNVFRGGWITCTKQYIGKLPIRSVDFSNPEEKSRHDQMVQLVERMLDLNKKLATEKTGHDKTVLQRQIDATDDQINRLVYELYELTDEETALVEENVGK